MEGIKEADEGKFVTKKQMKKSLKKWGIDGN
jgi:predicted transcriptional regulator